MDFKKLLTVLGFNPKENTVNVWSKKYQQVNGYCIEVDFEKQIINYGEKIQSDSKTTLNFLYAENFVVLECINRLLEKGYQPENITLEKTFPLGHNSGRLDILVTRKDGTAYLMIECKTYGKEFDKAFSKLKKDGGQLFTYFQQDKNADVLALYASEINGSKISYKNEIIHIEDDYRQTSNVNDFYDRWNKLPVSNGVFDDWVHPYCFESKAFTLENLEAIKLEDSSFIFNQFLEILRHNVVSDKPNAFNKIFTLFLCKIFDEKHTKPNEELAFQWFYTPYQYDGINYPPDNHISFQKRLTDLYRKGMKEFLDKEVTDISETYFRQKYGGIVNDEIRAQFLEDLTEIRLKKNNEFALKEVFDDDSFNENAKVVKEVVELLQRYKIRYAAKQQYLSDFFELLLTTGLKQESGQFFTPVPIAQFIIKSLPIDELIQEKLKKGVEDEYLPHIIDYAAGSGHFITESMHEVQRLLESYDSDKFFGETKKFVNKAKNYPYDWAFDYIYGVEKDYRLVKVGKVGCYLHGDGLAKVIHSDGLGNFIKTKEYQGLLRKVDKDFPKENKQFDIVISNPPYSVSAFKNNASKFYSKKDFDLYDYLTDNSSEIECLFIERTKQLLKDGGVAGVILPSSILSNEGIYTKAREIILKYFEIIAITELGSNTFMATGTNTVVLFLRRRNNYDCQNFAARLENSLNACQDNTINGIEKPVTQYLNLIWGNIGFEDYVTLLKKEPNKVITNHDIYKEYYKKLKPKNEYDFWTTVIEIEKEKLLYFILVYPQKVVLVKTGEKEAEKRFLGYEFSNRRGSEGIHPIQRGKTIEECTQLFDDDGFENPQKASTYIYKAFNNDCDFPIDESLKNNISRVRLVDMLTFDRAGFAKNISTAVKKAKIETKWGIVKIGDICDTSSGGTPISGTAEFYENGNILWINSGEVRQGVIHDSPNKITQTGLKQSSAKLFPKNTVLLAMYGATAGQVGILGVEAATNQAICGILPSNNILPQFLFYYLRGQYESILSLRSGVARLNISQEIVKNIKIPLPPKEIQEKIVSEIEVLEKKEAEAKEKVEELRKNIDTILDSKSKEQHKVGDILTLEYGAALPESNRIKGEFPVMGSNGIVGYHNEYLVESPSIIIGRKGSAGKVTWIDRNCYPIDTTFYAKLIDNQFNLKLIYYALQKINLENLSGGTGVPGLNRNDVYSKTIPLPSLPEQQKIVSEIEKIELQIDEAQKVINNISALKNEVLKKYL